MLRIFANDHYLALALDNLALFAHFLYRRFYFHFLPPFRLLCSESYSTLAEVIDGNLHGDLIAGYDFDIIHTHFPRNVSGDYVPVGKLYLEHGVGEHLNNNAFTFDYIGFSQNNSSFTVYPQALPQRRQLRV